MKKSLYLLIAIVLCLATPSCTRDSAVANQRYDRINDYAVFVSAGSRVLTGGGKAQVQLNIQLKNLNQIYESHIYAFQNTYQYTLQWDDKQQSVTDVFIDQTTTQRQYYFVVILTNNETITGKPFTVNF